ncbi:RNA-binding S4 domain-containing protein [Actinidia rufa]|uniref:RNA-binding S4 domain-containing protein n=1 Tax=Actinidia rufa TaxID=165716 RepID=A0A7J0G9Q2_9ERIC|nr:RNA-binding S4 domain-containing protein [Actinidia rufa]
MAASSFASHLVLRRALQAFVAPRPVGISNKLSPYRTFLSLPLTTSLSSSAAGICQVAQAIKGGDDVLLRGVGDKSALEAVKHIVELARRASSRREVLHSDFLTPPILKESMLVLEKLADTKTVPQGGYPQAERCRLSVGHPQALTTDTDIVAALRQVIECSFFSECSNNEGLLGRSWVILSCSGWPLGKDCFVWDMNEDYCHFGYNIHLLCRAQGEKGAHVLVVPELADFVTSALDKVGNVSVTCKKIPLLALEYEPPRTKAFKTVEASLRVDAIASAGFKISRTKLADLISSGDVRVNWTTVTKSNTTIKTGDIISVSGKGRLKIGEINSTKKGKFAVELIRYL